jgi:hypothetical protein
VTTTGKLRVAVDRARVRVDYARRQYDEERLFGPSTRSTLHQLEHALTDAERELAAARAKLTHG